METGNENLMVATRVERDGLPLPDYVAGRKEGVKCKVVKAKR